MRSRFVVFMLLVSTRMAPSEVGLNWFEMKVTFTQDISPMVRNSGSSGGTVDPISMIWSIEIGPPLEAVLQSHDHSPFSHATLRGVSRSFR